VAPRSARLQRECRFVDVYLLAVVVVLADAGRVVVLAAAGAGDVDVPPLDGDVLVVGEGEALVESVDRVFEVVAAVALIPLE